MSTSFFDSLSSWSNRPTQESFLYAAGTGDVTTVKKYLDGKGDPTVKDKSHNAFKNLFNFGDKPKFQNDGKPVEYTFDAIELACFNNQLDVMDLLLKDKKVRESLNKWDGSGEKRTILHWLADRVGSLKTIQKLLIAGAKPGVKDSSEMTPFEYAITNQNKELLELFFKYENEEIKKIVNQHLFPVLTPIVQEYDPRPLSHYVNLKHEKSDITPLHYAITAPVTDKSKEIILLLLENGADLKAIRRWFSLTSIPLPLRRMINAKAKEIKERQKKQADIKESPDADVKPSDP